MQPSALSAQPSACLCVVGCVANGICPLHGDKAVAAGRAAFETFYTGVRNWLPTGMRIGSVSTDWESQSAIVRQVWIAVAQAAVKVLQS